MVGYTYDFDIKSYGAPNVHWTTNEQGERIFEPIPGQLEKGLAFGGFLAGAGWLVAAVFFPTDLPIKILLAVGGVFFIVGGRLAGKFFEKCSRSFGPYLVFQTDGSLRFPRLKKTIVPNETTLVETLPTDQRGSGRTIVGLTDVIILHEDESYYVISGQAYGMYDKGSAKRIQKEITEALKTHCGQENRT